MKIPKAPLVLASASPVRKTLLEEAGLEFEALPSDVDEESLKAGMRYDAYEDLAVRLGVYKAQSVSAKRLGKWVIGADQLCVAGNRVFSKPYGFREAVDQLQSLQGKEHRLITAASLVKDGLVKWTGTEICVLRMKPLSPAAIESLVSEHRPYGSCGAYRYEDMEEIFSGVSGSREAVLGLPMEGLKRALEEFDAIPALRTRIGKIQSEP